MQKKIYLSVVIPVYNETGRITKGLNYALNFLKKQKYAWEIIIVNDGSTDATPKLAEKIFKKQKNCLLLNHEQNLGKGAAIRTGILSARGIYILFSDIDFSTPLSELPKFFKALKDHELAIGVRRHPQAQVSIHQSKLREFLGQCFTRMVNWMVTPDIYDATCGFKAYQSQTGKKLYKTMRVDRWAFDAEVLFLAKKYEFKIAQIPVAWANNPATKVNMLRDGSYAFWDLIKIRLYDLLKFYG